MSAKHTPLPSAGDRVRGQHILGAHFTGRITDCRPSTVNDDIVFTIAFDRLTELAAGDSRPAIIFTAIWPAHGDTKWQDGHGGWFEVFNPLDSASKTARAFSSSVIGLSNESEDKLAELIRADHARLLSRVAELEGALRGLIPAAEQDLRDAKALEHIAPKAVSAKRANLERARQALTQPKEGA